MELEVRSRYSEVRSPSYKFRVSKLFNEPMNQWSNDPIPPHTLLRYGCRKVGMWTCTGFKIPDSRFRIPKNGQ